MSMLYVWARPAVFSQSPVDHTWVTDYDLRTNQQQVDYWYCWGDFHTHASPPLRLLGTQNGSLNLARCLVKPNVSSTNDPAARGTIFSYGKDGVCHQLANQVLYATGGQNQPLEAYGANGYQKSRFIYGIYGLQRQAWSGKKLGCTTHYPLGVHIVAEQHDSFELYARNFITDEQKLNALLELRRNHQNFLFNLNAEISAEEINQNNQRLLDQAAELLGEHLFEKIFNSNPNGRTNLVDPEILEQMNGNGLNL